jgi:aryl-alcohol dehydrogenase-like predicted oxidoreductase
MSEDYIGRALEGRRDQVILATKFGSAMEENPLTAACASSTSR